METDHTDGPSSSGYPAGQTHGTPERPLHEVARALCTFDLAAEVDRLHLEESWRQGTRNAKTLVKEPDLRIVVIALRQGGRMEEHRAPGHISIHTLAGRLRLRVGARTVDLLAGHVLTLELDAPHDVEAVEESAFLLTIAWPAAHDHTVPVGSARSGAPGWADRLAQRRIRAHEALLAVQAGAAPWLPDAVALLWSLIDAAVAEVNVALEHAGLDERIAVRRLGHEYGLSAPGPDGVPRHVAFFVGARAMGGHILGGVSVTTSETRATIGLVPTDEGGRVRWLIPPAEREVTAGFVDDLLLSVFGDDPTATTRLSRYYTIDEDDL